MNKQQKGLDTKPIWAGPRGLIPIMALEWTFEQVGMLFQGMLFHGLQWPHIITTGRGRSDLHITREDL